MLRSGAQNVLLAGVVITLRGALAQRKAPGRERKYRSYGLNSFCMFLWASECSQACKQGVARAFDWACIFLRASVKHLVQIRNCKSDGTNQGKLCIIHSPQFRVL